MAAWALALASCLHIALAVLRQHRSSPGVRRVVFVGTSYVAAATPWIWPLPPDVAIAVIAHAAWLALTDGWARASRRARRQTDETASAPVASSIPARRTPAPHGFTPLNVLAVLDETPDIRTFRLSRPEGFVFIAGQFLPVRLRVDGVEHVRCYSISSAPHTPGYFEISVKRLGLVSSALHATLRPGTTLHARPPAGAFVYPGNDDRPLVLLAAGVGITPLASMARHAVHAEPTRPVVLVQSARTVEGLAFADEFRLLERRHPTFRWVPAVSGGASDAASYPGRIDRTLVEMTIPCISDSVVCLCGPASMIDAMRQLLASLAVPPVQVRFEVFEAAIASAGTDAPVDDTAADGVPSVTFSRSGARGQVRPGQTLLDVAEASGVDIPSLCRVGVCGTCRTRVSTGDVHCRSTALDPADAADGYVLACVAHARTDCAVDA